MYIYSPQNNIHNTQNPIDIYALINCLNAAEYRKQNTSYRYLVYTERIYDQRTHTHTMKKRELFFGVFFLTLFQKFAY